MNNPWMARPRKKKGKFRVGDRVKVIHGWHGLVAEIIEDRGNLGVGGRRIYTVRIVLDEWNTIEPEFAEDDLELA